MSNWRFHPQVRSAKELTLGERAADRMRNSFGSWTFIGSTCAFLAAWMVYNGHRGFDPYPWILLNLILSCFAAMQGAIILLAAKRADKISSELAQHDYEADITSRQLLTELRADFAVLKDQHAEQGRQLALLVAGTPGAASTTSSPEGSAT